MRALVTMLMAVIMVALGAVSYATEDLLALTNADRSRNGLAPLTIASDLQAYAQGWADQMMRAGQISHSPNLAAVTNSRRVAENVGQGQSLTEIQSAFMASPAHRANILRPDFSEAGVGVAWDGAEDFYVAVVLRQATTAAAPPPAEAEAEAKPVPAAPEATPPPAAPEPKPGPAAPGGTPAPAPRATSSPPTTGRPEPTPAPPPAMSSPADVPTPLRSTDPAGIEHPAPSAPGADPRLSWVLAATTGTSVSAAAAHGGASPARVVEASTGSADRDGSSPSVLMAVTFLGMVYAWTCIPAPTAVRVQRPSAERHSECPRGKRGGWTARSNGRRPEPPPESPPPDPQRASASCAGVSGPGV